MFCISLTGRKEFHNPHVACRLVDSTCHSGCCFCVEHIESIHLSDKADASHLSVYTSLKHCGVAYFRGCCKGDFAVMEIPKEIARNHCV